MWFYFVIFSCFFLLYFLIVSYFLTVLKWKKNLIIIMYFFFTWVFVGVYVYIYSQKLIYLFMKSLWKEEIMEMMLLDGQTLVMLLMDFSYFFSLFCMFLVFCMYLYYFLYPLLTKNESKNNSFIFFLFMYLFFISYWMIDQDMGFSVWEFVTQESSFLWVLLEYKMPINKIFFFFEMEFYDLFYLNTCMYLFMFCIFIKYQMYFYFSKIKNMVLLLYFLIVLFFFCGEGFYNDLKLIIFSFFLFELWYLTFILFYKMKHKLK